MDSRYLILLISLAFFIHQTDALGTIQSISATAQLLCEGKPYSKAKIKLYNVNLILDKLMSETVSGQDGYFKVSGSDTELTHIDPKVNIYHNCEDENHECLLKIQVKLPKEFITQGEHPEKTFDLGVLNLSGEYPGQSRDCIN